MATQTTLLQILQFVGLISPAIAILIDLLFRTHGGIETVAEEKRIPAEIAFLFGGFVLVLLGGAIIGLQLLSTFESGITQNALFLIFIGMMAFALAVVLTNLRLSGYIYAPHSFTELLELILKGGASVLPAPSFALLISGGSIYLLEDVLNQYLNWWIFYNNVKPSTFFYVMSISFGGKLVYTLWSNDHYPSFDYAKCLGKILLYYAVFVVMVLLFSGIPIIAFLIEYQFHIIGLEKSSNWAAIPYWFLAAMTLILSLIPLEEVSENRNEET